MFVLRGPPEVQISSPGEGATVVADTDLALAGAAGGATDGKLGGGALAWTVDGAAAGLGGSLLTTRIHALGHHVVTLRATNAAGIAGSRSVGIEVVRPSTTPAIGIGSAKDGAICRRAPRASRRKRATRTTAASRARRSGGATATRPQAGRRQDVALGTGEHVSATLYADAGGTPHTITATATNTAVCPIGRSCRSGGRADQAGTSSSSTMTATFDSSQKNVSSSGSYSTRSGSATSWVWRSWRKRAAAARCLALGCMPEP